MREKECEICGDDPSCRHPVTGWWPFMKHLVLVYLFVYGSLALFFGLLWWWSR